MQFRTALLSVFVAAAAAQNATDTSESLPDLVEQLPQCAMSCFQSAAKDINCAVTDFACLCGSKKQDFVNKITPCVAIGAGCSSDDLNSMRALPPVPAPVLTNCPPEAATLAPKICTAVDDNPSPAAVSSASALVAAAEATGSPGNAAGRPEIGYGLLGMAALAAAAL